MVLDIAGLVSNNLPMTNEFQAANPVESRARQRVRMDPAVRRQQIVAQATRLIAHSGFNAVSLADVASACDVRKSTILHYFPSMKALLVAVLVGRDARDLNLARTVDYTSIGASEVQALFTAKIEENLHQREIIRLFYVLTAEALSTEHPAHDYFRDRSQRGKAELRQLLAWKPDPAAAAIELLAFWHGLELEWLTDPEADILSAWHSFAHRFFAP